MEKKRKPGERGFAIILLIVGILALIESMKMFMKEPTSSSFGALPLFLSSVIVIFMIKIILFEDRSTGTGNKKGNFKELINSTLRYIFPKDIIVVFLFLILYCLLLVFGLGFEMSSTIFLIASMTYLMRGQILRNVIYTGLSMTFILVVFKTIFQVILP
ncbi:tripartite tricarboxylate transporter TctB family protein [Tissierella sp. Yu-01]|uniref:tripartite tricarboxylate transporter TctB family protein n=1 Tax=Tissierella sp. Yu-01 TaxID=3035694 RepID=UPI00240E8BD0|nr:tripartite tricarboxylate transporter TctB family protein [Tissierella sp. Yu-01]WFA07874.1 tripartite tricarboxylate transporter TctB family protein [Tissierella sp. Yu-01]